MRPRRSPARRGAAVVEFAVVLPFLIYLAVIGADWARLLHHTIVLEHAARSGALYAADPTSQPESPYYHAVEATGVENAVRATASGLEASRLHAPVIAKSTLDGRAVVEVTVTYDFTTITNFPGVPKAQSLTRAVEMGIIPQSPN